MQYLIVFDNGDQDPFYTKWFDYKNHFVYGMTIFDLHNNKWAKDGTTWMEIKQDHL